MDELERIELEDLDISVPVAAPPLEVLSTRALAADDLTLLSQPAARKAHGAALIKKLRDSHHALAKLLAQGMKDVEVSAITGYTTVRIRQLKEDPTFGELLSFYREQLTIVERSFHDRLVSVGFDALQELAHRLDENPAEFKPRELKEVAEMVADRTGFGPKTTQVNVNVDLAARVEAARRRALEGRQSE